MRIGGKRYTRDVTHTRKEDATNTAKRWRKQGKKARVIKDSAGHSVYVR